jgi:drug/metabolite transporter (DMT)-like permease
MVLRERFSLVHAGAIGALLLGFAILGGGGPRSFGWGEVMILAATLLWAGEVILIKTILPTVSAQTAAMARMCGGSVLLLGWVIVRGDLGEMTDLSSTQWMWLAATGATLATFVTVWYHALAWNPAIDVTAVLVLGAVVTGILETGLRNVPVTANSSGYLLLTAAVLAVVARGLRPGESRLIG